MAAVVVYFKVTVFL